MSHDKFLKGIAAGHTGRKSPIARRKAMQSKEDIMAKKATIKRNSDTWEAAQFGDVLPKKSTLEDAWARLVSTDMDHSNVQVIKDSILVGRRDDADVWLKDGAISNTHCKIWRERTTDSKDEDEEDAEYVVWLEDLSTNGTFVKDKRVGKGNKVQLTTGTEVVLIPRGTKRPKLSYIIYIPKTEEQEQAPEGVVTFVFTDVQSSTPLWEKTPKEMNEALKRHDRLLRKLLRKHKGYEVKTEGDAFMVAFFNVVDAIMWCLAVQEGLLKVKWPEKLLEQAPASVSRNSAGETIFAGIRVRMGVHTGECEGRRNPVTSRMDYFGPTVNRAARVSDSGHGGQIVMTTEVQEMLEKNRKKMDRDDVVVRDLGMHSYKGIKGKINVFQINSKALSERRFPALRSEESLSRKKARAHSRFASTSFDNLQALLPDDDDDPVSTTSASRKTEVIEPPTPLNEDALDGGLDDLDGDVCSRPGCDKTETFDTPFGACARCKSVKYCGTDCQKQHWKAHKKMCKELAKATAAMFQQADRQPTVRINGP